MNFSQNRMTSMTGRHDWRKGDNYIKNTAVTPIKSRTQMVRSWIVHYYLQHSKITSRHNRTDFGLLLLPIRVASTLVVAIAHSVAVDSQWNIAVDSPLRQYSVDGSLLHPTS
mmetsp:Transcript_17645/g.25482  ORF Transcript_17645/g.25482 Transcript_17645/m.25482 type:complete len:112 (+) Transcript_17645:155-490(+)